MIFNLTIVRATLFFNVTKLQVNMGAKQSILPVSEAFHHHYT